MANETAPQQEITQYLLDWGKGDKAALEAMLPLVYAELRRIAVGRLRREKPGHTLQPTALVHEAYLRLIGQERASWRNRAQFFGVAAEMMRRILINHALEKQAQKRGAGAVKVTLGAADRDQGRAPDFDILALDEALKRLATFDARKSRLIELKFFGGLTIEEIAEVTGLSHATVEREWTTARAWLYRELSN